MKNKSDPLRQTEKQIYNTTHTQTFTHVYTGDHILKFQFIYVATEKQHLSN